MPQLIRFWIKNTRGSEAFEFVEFEHNTDPQAIRTALEKWCDAKYADWMSKGVQYGAEYTVRPPADWLVDRLVQLKSNVMREMAAIQHYEDLLEDNGGRRRKTFMEWLAGSVISKQKREANERRKKRR